MLTTPCLSLTPERYVVQLEGAEADSACRTGTAMLKHGFVRKSTPCEQPPAPVMIRQHPRSAMCVSTALKATRCTPMTMRVTTSPSALASAAPAAGPLQTLVAALPVCGARRCGFHGSASRAPGTYSGCCRKHRDRRGTQAHSSQVRPQPHMFLSITYLCTACIHAFMYSFVNFPDAYTCTACTLLLRGICDGRSLSLSLNRDA